VPDLTLDPVPPFVWPDPRVFGGSHAYTSAVPYDSVISRARGLAGVVTGVDLRGARWLAELVSNRNLQSRLVIVLYPACPTRAEVLDALHAVQSIVPEPTGRVPGPALVELRLLPFEEPSGDFPNSKLGKRASSRSKASAAPARPVADSTYITWTSGSVTCWVTTISLLQSRLSRLTFALSGRRRQSALERGVRLHLASNAIAHLRLGIRQRGARQPL